MQACLTVALPRTSPVDTSPTTSDTGNPDDGDRRLRVRPITPGRPSPSMPLPDDAPENIETAKFDEHALTVMSKATFPDMGQA